MLIPFGTYTTEKRGEDRPAVLPSAARAGTMLSSSGRASAAPIPRSIVRRESALWVTIMARATSRLATLGGPLSSGSVDDGISEREALDDAQNEGRPSVASSRCLPDDPADDRPIIVLDPAPERVGQELFRHRRGELRRVGDQRLPQRDRAIQPGPVGHHPGRVHRL